MDLMKIQRKLDENRYDYTLEDNKLNQLKFVHISLMRKISNLFNEDKVNFNWNDNPSISELLKINNDVFVDLNIDTRVKDNDEYGIHVDGLYIPENLPVNVFNSIANKLYNIALAEKRKCGNSEYIYFWWD